MALHLHPKTSVDTATIADKVVAMFDDILQARLLSCFELRAARMTSALA